MREMGWSWEQLQATPRYVRSFCMDFIELRQAAEAKAADKAKPRPSGGE